MGPLFERDEGRSGRGTRPERVADPAHTGGRDGLDRVRSKVARPTRDEFALAVEIDPVNDYAHFGLGRALTRLGDLPAARRHLKLAVVMRPLDDYRIALAELGDEAPGGQESVDA